MARAPFIEFQDTNVGLALPRPNVLNRIAIIDRFNRGPANLLTYIGNFSDFAYRYGSDTSPGSLQYQAVYDQFTNPDDANIALVRVTGRGRPASASLTFSGVAGVNNTLNIHTNFVGEVIAREDAAADIVWPMLTNTAAAPVVNSKETVTAEGPYTGSTSGRYFLRVDDVNTGVATIKWQFVPLGQNPLNWAAVTTDIDVNIAAGVDSSSNILIPLTSNNIRVRFGTVAGTALNIVEGNSWSIRVNKYVVSVPISNGDLPNQIVTSLISASAGMEPFGEITRNVQDNGVVIQLEPALTGSISNRFSFYVTADDNTVNRGFTTSPALVTTIPDPATHFTSFQGGLDGPRSAFRDFYTFNGTPLLRLQAVSEGNWGNQVTVSIYPVSNSEFRLTVRDLNGGAFNPPLADEVYTVKLEDTNESGELNALLDSKFIRGFFLPKSIDPINYDATLVRQSPLRLAPPDESETDVENPTHVDFYGPNVLIDVTLENGYDGPPVTNDDYVSIIRTLENQPVHILLVGTTNVGVQQALITEAERASDSDGLRIAVLAAPPRTTPTLSASVTRGFNSSRAVMVAGWFTYAGQPNSSRYGVPGAAVYAGKLAAIDFFVSPAARSIVGPLLNIIESDTDNYASRSNQDIYSAARLEVLSLDTVDRTYRFASGVTLSTDPAWERIYLRRAHDVVRQGAYAILRNYVAMPNSRLVRNQIAAALNAFMGELKRNGSIVSFRPAIIDSSNNSTASYFSRELYVSLQFQPLYSADYIYVTISRDTETSPLGE